MEYNVTFDICAVFVSVVLIMAFYYNKAASSFKTRVFEWLLWTNTLAAATDALTIYAGVDSCPLTLKWLVNMAYYIVHSGTIFLGAAYFVVIAEPLVKMSFARKAQLVVPYALQVALIAFDPLMRILFYFDSDGNYHRGKLIWLCYVISIYYLVYMIVFVLKRSDFFDKRARLVIVGFALMYIIPMAVQIVLPDILVECFAATVLIMVLYVVYQHDDESIDSATKLFSYQAFENDCRAYIATGMNFSVLMIKLRDAKFISDVFGNQFYTKVRAAFANYIRQFVRHGNAYSLGGGVFGLCFVNEGADPKNVIESITERMKQPWGFEEMVTKLSASMSLVSYPLHASDHASYMELTDIIFNRCESKPDLIYADDVVVKDRRRKADIERALLSEDINGKIEIFYHPSISVKDNKFTVVEALVRLKDDKLGYIMPDEFIPAAEKNGTMIRIGEYIFESVCRFISESSLDELGVKFVAVNLSVNQCMQADLVSKTLAILQKYDVSPSKICFEISELAAIDPPDILISNIRELHRLGVSFALDHYGTGHSSLQQLTILPIRFIKFDDSFIRSAFNSDRGKTLLESAINMSKSINLSIVAEGIENEQTAAKLHGLDFDYYQGYYYAPVCSADELADKLRELGGTQKL